MTGKSVKIRTPGEHLGVPEGGVSPAVPGLGLHLADLQEEPHAGEVSLAGGQVQGRPPWTPVTLGPGPTVIVGRIHVQAGQVSPGGQE